MRFTSPAPSGAELVGTEHLKWITIGKQLLVKCLGVRQSAEPSLPAQRSWHGLAWPGLGPHCSQQGLSPLPRNNV